MKTLKEIKDEVAFEYDWIDFVCFKADCDITDVEIVYDEIVKRYAKEVAKQALINASRPKDEYGNYIDLIYENGSYHVKEDLITNESNIPDL